MKYTKQQITDKFYDNVNKVEFDKFCELLKIDFNYIYDWYESFIYGCNDRLTPRYILYEKDNKCFEKLLEDKYKIYFRDEKRRLRNIEKKNKKEKRKNKKNKKNTDNEEVFETLSFNIPQDGLAENFYLSATISVKQEGDFGLNYIPIRINGNYVSIPIQRPNYRPTPI